MGNEGTNVPVVRQRSVIDVDLNSMSVELKDIEKWDRRVGGEQDP